MYFYLCRYEDSGSTAWLSRLTRGARIALEIAKTTLGICEADIYKTKPYQTNHLP